ncbi:protein kinase, partial [Achlya hypogyna]
MKNQEARMVQKFIDEIVLMSQMDSDYIVKFVGASWTRPIEIECVVEYMDLGDLRSYLVAHPPSVFTWDQKYNCIVSIVRGLVYLHTYKPPIIHRDLKSRNVLLDSVKGTKLTDFGASRVAEEDDLMTNGIGTYQWMAPEVIAGTSYGAAADIYSFGIILSEFCTHQVPYADLRHPETNKPLPQHYVLNEVRAGSLHPTLAGEGVPSWVADIAMQCLQLNEEDRPTALMLSSLLSRCKPRSGDAHPPFSLVEYDEPILVEANPHAELNLSPPKEPIHAAEPTISPEILRAMLPPREWKELSGTWMQHVSMTPSSRADVVALQEKLDAMLLKEQAKKHDEMIRQVTLACPERGLMLLRIRDEIRMTIEAYQALYNTSLSFGIRKTVMAEEGMQAIEDKLSQLETTNAELREAACYWSHRLKVLEHQHAMERQTRLAQQTNVVTLLRDQIHHFETFGDLSDAIAAAVFSADTCKYSYYGPDLRVYTTDESCGPVPADQNVSYCVVNSTNCEIVANITMNGRTKLPFFNAIGDITKANIAYLRFGNKSLLVMKGMSFPSTLTHLLVENITTLDFNQLTKPFPLTMRRIEIIDSYLDVFPATFSWPTGLKNLTLRNNRLQTIPKGLPDGLASIAIQNNTLNDFNYLPPNLTFINIRNNLYEKVTDKDWTNLYYLQMSYNPIKTFANVKLSPKIRFFSCVDCPITNFTINQATFDAVDVLPKCGEDEEPIKLNCFRFNQDINVDAAACTAIQGTIQTLWAGKADNKINLGTQQSAGEYSDMGLNVEDLRIHKLDNADLKVVSKKPLASGAFGEVWLGTYCDEKVAVKRIKDRRIESVKKFIEEIKLMAMMDSEFVVKFVGVSWRRPIEMEVVVEYMDIGDLRNFLMTRTPATYSWPDKFTAIMSIVRGLVYLHTFEPPIIHRDLKSRNVLLDSKKGTKLTDFGASREAADAGMTNGIGTYQWMAPEIILGTEYTIAADIYSFGVILSEMSTHAVPYGDVKNPATGRAYTQQAIMSKVTAGELRPTFEQYDTPVWVRDLGMQCMALDPDDRPTSLTLTAILQRVKT